MSTGFLMHFKSIAADLEIQSFYHCNNHVFILCLYCTMYQDLDAKELMLIKLSC